MWHEARKQEKKIRVMVVDYKRRAERRREFYEKFKADPTQFMQVHGRPCKIHLDPQVSAAADNCMMPWQGDKESLIDRFDVRAHLDIIQEYHSPPEGSVNEAGQERNPSSLGYERYRILIQNELSKVSEDKFLHQIHLEEQYGTAVGPGRHKSSEAAKPVVPKAAIGYNYEDSNPTGNTWTGASKSNTQAAEPPPPEEESDEEVDFDLLVNMDDLTLAQKAELNMNGESYGLGVGEFMNFLNADLEEKEQIRLTKLQEEEKQAMSGRKARRERRAYKDRMILRKGYISPPSYAAAAESPAGEAEDEKRSSSESRSRSSSPAKIEFITSFGGNESGGEKDGKDKLPISAFGPAAFLAGGLPRQARKWAKSRSRSPERRKMRSRSKSRDRSSRYRSVRDRKDRRKRSSSSSSSSKRSRRRRHNRRSSRSSSSSRSRSRDRSRRKSHRPYSKSRNGRSRSRSRDNKHSHRRRSSERKRKSSSSRSRTSSSSSSRSRSPKGRKGVDSKSRRHSSSSRSPRKSKSKERPAIGSSVVNKPSQATGPKNGNEFSSNLQQAPKPPSPPLKRYYGRRKEESESDSISVSESEEDKPKLPEVKEYKRSDRNSGTKGKSSVSSSSKTHSSHNSHTPSSSSGGKLTPQERLKKKVQAALNRQLRADKEAEKVRQDKHDQERMEREETLRELTIKYRRRERERRHREIDVNPRTRSSSYSSDASSGSHSSGSKSRSLSGSPKQRRRARSRSNSP